MCLSDLLPCQSLLVDIWVLSSLKVFSKACMALGSLSHHTEKLSSFLLHPRPMLTRLAVCIPNIFSWLTLTPHPVPLHYVSFHECQSAPVMSMSSSPDMNAGSGKCFSEDFLVPVCIVIPLGLLLIVSLTRGQKVQRTLGCKALSESPFWVPSYPPLSFSSVYLIVPTMHPPLCLLYRHF